MGFMVIVVVVGSLMISVDCYILRGLSCFGSCLCVEVGYLVRD